ncbi:MAG: YfiR family protein [Candidatus Acidiferrales bacterium]
MNRRIHTSVDPVSARYSHDPQASASVTSLFPRHAFLLLLILMASYGPSYAQGKTEEYHVKAGFLFHFAQLVDWPAAAGGGPTFDLCILGDDPFRGELENTLNGKVIGSKPIRVLHLKQPQEARNCQVLFISTKEDERLSKIFEGLGSSAVMTVGESDDFIERGGMIRFTLEQEKVRFEINLKAADPAGLKFSSRLLLLAKNVFGKQG